MPSLRVSARNTTLNNAKNMASFFAARRFSSDFRVCRRATRKARNARAMARSRAADDEPKAISRHSHTSAVCVYDARSQYEHTRPVYNLAARLLFPTFLAHISFRMFCDTLKRTKSRKMCDVKHFQMDVLSPRAFIAGIFSPVVMAARIISPAAFRTMILSPITLNFWLMTPEAFMAKILAPKAVDLRVLSPESFSFIVLSPGERGERVQPTRRGAIVCSRRRGANRLAKCAQFHGSQPLDRLVSTAKRQSKRRAGDDKSEGRACDIEAARFRF